MPSMRWITLLRIKLNNWGNFDVGGEGIGYDNKNNQDIERWVVVTSINGS